jgi:hypothetical protein
MSVTKVHKNLASQQSSHEKINLPTSVNVNGAYFENTKGLSGGAVLFSCCTATSGSDRAVSSLGPADIYVHFSSFSGCCAKFYRGGVSVSTISNSLSIALCEVETCFSSFQGGGIHIAGSIQE